MATIVMHPAMKSPSSRPARDVSERRVGPGAILLALAAPILAVALSWAMVDAVAYTQHSLTTLYSAASSTAA